MPGRLLRLWLTRGDGVGMVVGGSDTSLITARLYLLASGTAPLAASAILIATTVRGL